MKSIANNLKLIVVIYALSLGAATILMMMVERRAFLDALYWASTTATTVGYGDIAPTTPLGRVVAIFFQHLWLYAIASLIVANIILRVIPDPHQYSDEEQEWNKASMLLLAKRLGVTLPPPPANTEYRDKNRK